MDKRIVLGATMKETVLRKEHARRTPTARSCASRMQMEPWVVLASPGINWGMMESGITDIFVVDVFHIFIFSCADIDECAFETDPVCSQTCTNTLGSFTCGCMTGYILRPDLRSCKALGGHPTLLFANRVDIRQVSLSNSKYTAILKGLHNAIALDYHYKKDLIFWSDVSIAVIRSAYINGTSVKGNLNSLSTYAPSQCNFQMSSNGAFKLQLASPWTGSTTCFSGPTLAQDA